MFVLRMSIVLVIASMFSSSVEAQLFRFRPNPTFNARLNAGQQLGNPITGRLSAALQQGIPSRYNPNTYQYTTIEQRTTFIPSQPTVAQRAVAPLQQTPACNRQQQTVLVPANAAARQQQVQLQVQQPQRLQFQQVQVQQVPRQPVQRQQVQIQVQQRPVQQLQLQQAAQFQQAQLQRQRQVQQLVQRQQQLQAQQYATVRQAQPVQVQNQGFATYRDPNTGRVFQQRQYLRPVQPQTAFQAAPLQVVRAPFLPPATPLAASSPVIQPSDSTIANVASPIALSLQSPELEASSDKSDEIATASFDDPAIESEDDNSEFSVLNSGSNETAQPSGSSVLESALPTLEAPESSPAGSDPGTLDLDTGELDLDLPPLGLPDSN